jgi:hypothetical protein
MCTSWRRIMEGRRLAGPSWSCSIEVGKNAFGAQMADVVGVGVEYALGGRHKAHRAGAHDALGVEDVEAGVGRRERHEV